MLQEEKSGYEFIAPAQPEDINGSGSVQPEGAMPSARSIDVSTFPGMVNQGRRIISRKMRPWVEFFGQGLFSKPADKAEVMARVERNLRYFFVNYVLLAVSLSLFAILTNPKCLVIIVMMGCLMFYVTTREDQLLLPRGVSIPKQKGQIGVLVILMFLLLVFAGALLFAILGFCIACVLFHSTFHVGKVYDDISSDGDVP